MSNYLSHDQVIAKIQHFADSLQQRKLEKEALSIVISDKSLKSEIRSEILIYEEILEDYDDTFQDILVR
jgi:hypothetical protein